MSREPLVADVEAELLRLAHEAPDWETVAWLAAVADCFGGGDFELENFGSLRWRLGALVSRIGGPAVLPLVDLCQAVLDTERTRSRNRTDYCGNLRLNKAPAPAGSSSA